MTMRPRRRLLIRLAAALCAVAIAAQLVAPMMPRHFAWDWLWVSPAARHERQWSVRWNGWAIEVGHTSHDEEFVSDAQRDAWRQEHPDKPWPGDRPLEYRGPDWSYGEGARDYALGNDPSGHVTRGGRFLDAYGVAAGWHLRVPFCLLLLTGLVGGLSAALLPPLAAIRSVIGPWATGMRDGPPDRVCRSCGYDLTGNVSGVCPECGRGIVEVGG